MSNHWGGELLNSALILLVDYNFYTTLGKENTLKFINEIIVLGMDNDCNAGEILDGIGQHLRICYQCIKYAKKIDKESGICAKCAH